MAGKNSEWEDELIDTGRRKKERKKNKKNKAAESEREISRRQRVRVDFGENEKPQNGYYLAVAERYRGARYVSFILLIAFLIVMLVFYRDSITYSNLMYLVRDLDSGVGINIGSFADISYEEQYKRSFAMFRGRIAAVSSTSFDLYGSAGSVDISDDISFAAPVVEAGEKYALVYDAGGNAYNIYTGVSRVLSANAEETIEDGCISESGSYALMTRSKDSKFLITVYDAGFRPVMEYYKDKYVIDIALDSDASEIAVVSADVGTSDISAEVMLGSVGSEDSETLSIPSQMPLFCRYAEDGTLMVLCDKAVIAVRDGKIAWQNPITSMTPSSFDMCENTFALAASKNAISSENEIFVFDTEGNILYNNIINKKVSYIAADGDSCIYTVGDGSADRITLGKDGSKAETDTEEINGRVLGALAIPGSLIVCMPDGTKSLFVGE